MRKSTLFISAVLTTFVMAMLAGVASAYQNAVQQNTEQAAATQVQTQPQPQAKSISHAMSADSQFTVTPEQAAGLAAQLLGREDLFSVEVTDLEGEMVYMVTFSSGDLVYVGMDGQILSLGKVEVNTVVVNTGGSGRDERGVNKNPQPSDSNQSQEKHEDHDDHEDDDHEEHDD
jgi:hypothetical protein